MGSRRQNIRCLEERIVELEAENAHLRYAAAAFGELAERLNERLREVQQNKRASAQTATPSS